MRTTALSAAVVLFLALSRAAAQQASPARTLREAYDRALTASESIGIDEQSVRQATELYRRTLGNSLPAFTFRTLTSWVDGTPGQLATGSMSQTDAGFRVGQSNFTFYRELAAVHQAKTGIRVQEEDLLRAKQLLLVTVAAAFYGQLQAQDNVAATVRLRAFADKRLDKLHEWVRVGRSREPDALAQDSQISTLESQEVENRRQAAADSDLLSFLTKATVDPTAADAPPAEEPKPLSEYLARMEARPDVQAARWTFDFAQAGVRVARGDRFPQFSWFGDGYTSRPSAKRTSYWDAQLTVSLPLFSWGAVTAEINGAKAASAAADLALQAARRAAELDIRNSYRNYAAARRQFQIEKHAVEIAEHDFDLQRQDENRGLVTAIDVLQSLDRLNTARLAYDNALLNERLAAVELEVSAGARPEDMELK